MVNKVEQVARAICQVNQMDPDSKSHIDGNAWLWQDYVKDARAAIQAMREPTEAMREAGHFFAGGESGPCFAAMIEQALEET